MVAGASALVARRIAAAALWAAVATIVAWVAPLALRVVATIWTARLRQVLASVRAWRASGPFVALPASGLVAVAVGAFWLSFVFCILASFVNGPCRRFWRVLASGRVLTRLSAERRLLRLLVASFLPLLMLIFAVGASALRFWPGPELPAWWPASGASGVFLVVAVRVFRRFGRYGGRLSAAGPGLYSALRVVAVALSALLVAAR